jgi:hypothetical protein
MKDRARYKGLRESDPPRLFPVLVRYLSRFSGAYWRTPSVWRRFQGEIKWGYLLDQSPDQEPPPELSFEKL